MNEFPVILLVDDSELDAMLMRTVFERASLAPSLRVAGGGEEAIAYLGGDGAYSDRDQFPMPTAVLLDLNMPRKNGFEVLTWIRRQPGLKHLHVYVLSASSRAEDIQRSYDLGANSYLIKPGTLNQLTALAKTVVAWLKLSQFSHRGVALLNGAGCRTA
jgi:CheY-like chemotaxis protein